MKLTKSVLEFHLLSQELAAIKIENFKFKYVNVKNIKKIQNEIEAFMKSLEDEKPKDLGDIESKPVDERTEDEKIILNDWNTKINESAKELEIEIDIMGYKVDWFPDDFSVQTLMFIEEYITE